MRIALAERNFAEVFDLLRAAGTSQRAIAALSGLAASEVYEVTRGRKVMSYDVLVRIADGLGVPRGYLGLAYDAETIAFLGAHGVPPGTASPPGELRDLLEHAAEVTVGVNVPGSDHQWTTTPDRTTPLPRRAGASDAEQVEQVTAALRALDHRYGGGSCREAVVAHGRWVQQLLHLGAAGDVRLRLHRSLADLHNLAGWTSFDVGLRADARRHYALALTHAREAGEPSLVANILYRIGRLHLHDREAHDALRFFQLGHISARESGSARTSALLWANEAWAAAVAQDPNQALSGLARAEDDLGRDDATEPAPWIAFFGRADLDGVSAMTRVELGGEHQLDQAQGVLHRVLAEREHEGPAMDRSRAFELTGLAAAQIRTGGLHEGIETAQRAVDLARHLRSVRVWDRLQPLAELLGTATHPQAQDLARAIRPEPAG